jgi:hypothetical protein
VIKQTNILRIITEYYLSSPDFRGFPLRNFTQVLQLEEHELKDSLVSLIQENKISLVFGNSHTNPHLKLFPEEPTEKQIEKLQASKSKDICAYPSRSHLQDVVNPSKYKGKPFTLRLALGEPQLSFEKFDLAVLEFYRNDPRYNYLNNDISGNISISDEYFESNNTRCSDKVMVEFGFAYNHELNRAIAAFLRDLSRLSPEHQQIWNAKFSKATMTYTRIITE